MLLPGLSPFSYHFFENSSLLEKEDSGFRLVRNGRKSEV